MLSQRVRPLAQPGWLRPVVAVLVLLGAGVLGYRSSAREFALLFGAGAALSLLIRPDLGLLAIVAAALVVPLEFGTGTAVSLNVAALLVPSVAAVWIIVMVLRRQIRVVPGIANLPLALFLGASLLSLLIGRVTWDPFVPRAANFTLVQLAQWAIFAFSAAAFWLTANLVSDGKGLWWLTAVFLAVGGCLAIVRMAPGTGTITGRLTTAAFTRAPFWTLLAALSGGQLLFNRTLPPAWRIFLVVVLGACLVYAFVQQLEAASNWVGLVVALGMLIWFRFPRLRWPLAAVLIALIVLGVLIPSIYQFAGGDQEWEVSGGSRLVLAQRVVEVAMRNPITGLGPAAYRPYANMKPLLYQRAYWIEPQINSHNNYIDLFAHGGLLGLALFAWFTVALARTGLRLRGRFTQGFAAGYLNGVLAAGAASLVIMLLADWILPFVYNIGFPGFQASVLVWLFMGGVVALENMPSASPTANEAAAGP